MEKFSSVNDPVTSGNCNLIQVINLAKDFFEGAFKDSMGNIHDISFNQWVSKDMNIQTLCKSFDVSLKKENYSMFQEEMNENEQQDSSLPSEIMKRHDFGCELKLLKWITEDEEHKKNFIKVGNKGQKINRHNDILPYEFNVVPKDISLPFKTLSNYINASFIDGPFKENNKLFIATQGPLKETIPSFWKMIYSHKIHLIIMLSSPAEEAEGRSVEYWPKEKNNCFFFSLEKDHEENCTESIENNCKCKNNEIKIEWLGEEVILSLMIVYGDLILCHMHIFSWPDHSLPPISNSTFLMEEIIKYIDKETENQNKSPVVIHCSAGVGRTGTVIAIYNIIKCLKFLKKNKCTQPFINVFNVVRKLREQRYALVTDKEQYKFIYCYVLEWIKKNYIVES